MRGEPIEAVKAGIDALLKSLCNDPYALETAYLSIITYNSQAEQQRFPISFLFRTILHHLFVNTFCQQK